MSLLGQYSTRIILFNLNWQSVIFLAYYQLGYRVYSQNYFELATELEERNQATDLDCKKIVN